MEHKCPVCGCTKYIEFGRFHGAYEMLLSDDDDEKKVVEEMGYNDDLYSGIEMKANVYVKCYECGKKYK
ncbi:hypothetical protein ACBP45_07145 [Latilactobacillus sakei]